MEYVAKLIYLIAGSAFVGISVRAAVRGEAFDAGFAAFIATLELGGMFLS